MHEKQCLRVQGYQCGSNGVSSAKSRPPVCSIPPIRSAPHQIRRPSKERALMEGQYSKSLEQQVKLLELENKFLKSKVEPVRGASTFVVPEECSRYQGQTIHIKGEQVSLNGRDWCKLPPYHPPLERVLGYLGEKDKHMKREPSEDSTRPAKPHQYEEESETRRSFPRRPTAIQKRPSAITERSDDGENQEVTESERSIDKANGLRKIPSLDHHQALADQRSATVSRRDTLEHRTTIPAHQIISSNGRRSVSVDRRQSSIDRREAIKRGSLQQGVDSGREGHEASDADLLRRLNDQSRRILELENEVNHYETESESRRERIATLTAKLREVEQKLSSKSESDSRDKRALMEELLEMQKRLDDLTPTLAEKEAIIARLENDRDSAQAELRTKISQITSIQSRLNEKEKEEVVLSEREFSQKSEIRRIQEQMESIQKEKSDEQTRNAELKREIYELKHLLKEEQHKMEKERTLNQRLSEENAHLLRERTTLSTEVSHIEEILEKTKRELNENLIDGVTRSQVEQIRESENRLRQELILSNERIRSEQDRNALLSAELAERETADELNREGRERIQKELDALHALSRSLSDENSQLREEKMTLLEKIDALRLKLSEKDLCISDLEDQLKILQMEHAETVTRLQREARSQTERTIQLEEVSRKLKDLSKSLPSSERAKVVTILEETSPRHEESEGSSRSYSTHHRRTETVGHRFSVQESRRSSRMSEVEQQCPSTSSASDMKNVLELTRSALDTLKRSSHV